MKQDNRDSLTFVMLLFILMAVGAFFLLIGMKQGMPNCPTEDSCSIEYHDGAWHVTEDK